MRIKSGPGSFRIDTWQELWEAMFRALGFALWCEDGRYWSNGELQCPGCGCDLVDIDCDYCLYECYDGGPR